VTKYKTDALKADTDGDGLSDGDEVNTRKTDPLKADTDGGTVNDGTEVTNGTNPLNPTDDVKKEELVVEVGKAIVLDGVVFASGKSDLTPESESILEKAYNTLHQNPEVTVEIQGHTDNTGRRATNTKLSLARADAVKAWLVAKGVEEARITTKGFGPDKPIAPNTSAEGRQKNRRIEFFRVK
jgi:outer membrane protein OmpA-like peptidoglycan-associated protein